MEKTGDLMTVNDKFIEYIKDFFLSLIKSKNLFRFAWHNFVGPLIVLVATSLVIALPTHLSINNVNMNTVQASIPHVKAALAEALTVSRECKVENDALSCPAAYDPYMFTYTDSNNVEFKYSVFINSPREEVDKIPKTSSIGYADSPVHENYIYFGNKQVEYRFVYHNPSNSTVAGRIGYGDYKALNGTDFAKITEEYNTILANQGEEKANEYVNNKAENLIISASKSLQSQINFQSIVSSLFFYYVLILIGAAIVKGNFLFKRKKGFSFWQAIKITVMASFQSILIASLVFFTTKMTTLANILALTFTVRILYIYFRYTISAKRLGFYKDLYDHTKSDRFKFE